MGDRIFLNKGGVDSHCDSYCNRNCCSFTVVAGCYFFHEIFLKMMFLNLDYKLKFKNNKILDQDIIFEGLIGRIRDIEVNSKGEIFLINSNSNASLWKMEKL